MILKPCLGLGRLYKLLRKYSQSSLGVAAAKIVTHLWPDFYDGQTKKVKLPFEHFFSQGHQMSGPIVSNLICFHNFLYTKSTKTSSAALWKTRNSLRAFRVLVFFWFWQKTLSSFFQCQLASFLANWGLFLQGKYGSKKPYLVLFWRIAISAD